MSRKTTGIRRVTAYVLVLLCLLIMTACGDSTSESTSATTGKATSATSGMVTTTTTQETVTTTTSGVSADSSSPETGAVTVLVEGVEADTIRYYQGSENYPFCVIEKDGKYGLIDYKGDMVVPMEYGEICLSTTGPYSEEIKLGAAHEYPFVYWFEADGTVATGEYDSWGYEYSEEICWYNGAPVVIDHFNPYAVYDDYTYDAYGKMENHVTFGLDFVSYDPPSVIPIRELKRLELDENEDVVIEFVSDNYALFDLKSAKLLTGFIYEEYALDFVNGLMAVKRNGKWGYIRENGTVVTGFVYDPVVHEEYDSGYGYSALYTPVNGYIAVSQRGKWGIIDTDGKTVVEPQYEDITQVNDRGEFWFKRNGKWSAARLAK